MYTKPPLQFMPCFFVGNSAVHTVNIGIKYDLSCFQKSAHCADIKIVSSVPPSTMNERSTLKYLRKILNYTSPLLRGLILFKNASQT